MGTVSTLRWSITLVDETGSSGLMRGHMAPGTQADAALAYVTGLASAASPLSSCTVVRAAVSYRISYAHLSTPVAGTIARQQGIFAFNTAEAPYIGVVSVPGVPSTVTQSTGCFSLLNIDLSSPHVSSFCDAVSQGIWSDPFAVDFGPVKVAYIREVR